MELISNNLDKITSIVLLIIFSLYLRALLQLVGQSWISTIAHTATITLLPILTFIITNVISGNIALSLGMVGALSIVRFRNPVRSPLELSVYFGAITMGISAAVSIKWLVLLIGSVTLVAFVLLVLNIVFTSILKKPLFISSFSEGNNLSTLNVITKENIEFIEQDTCLISKSINNSEISYTLASLDFEHLRKLSAKAKGTNKAESLQLTR